MKIRSLTLYIILPVLVTALATGCDKDDPAALPVTATLTISDVTFTSAKLVSVVTSDGGGEVTARGVVWGTTSGPSLESGSSSVDGVGIGSFNSDITGLTPGLAYFARSYATNSAGTSYGNELPFTTQGTSLPQVTMTALESKSATEAIAGLTVTNSAAPITAKGFCWSATPGPTIALTTKVDIAHSENDYSSVIPGLTPNTTYYVRAYATNLLGTSYSEEKTVKTVDGVAQVTLSAKKFTSGTSFTVEGKTVDNGGSTVTDQGFCWSTSLNPTIELTTKVSAGAPVPGQGFSADVTGLSAGTTYYVRAYAVNGVAVSYSTAQISVRMPSVGTTVTDADGNSYGMVFIGMQYWMGKNLTTSRYRDGTPIASDLDNVSWSTTTSGAYAIYNKAPYNTPDVNNSTYGKLYNFFAVVDPRNVCPVGTHVPSNQEWNILAAIGGYEGALKEAGHVHWQSDLGEGTNYTAFTALPGGERGADGNYASMGSIGTWWSNQEISATTAQAKLMWTNDLSPYGGEKTKGYSVRCLAD